MERKKSNETEEARHVAENTKFLNGLINLNSSLVNKVNLRMPNYKYKRFADACDVIKTFPFIQNVREFLNSRLNFQTMKDLEEYNCFEDAGFLELAINARKRFHQFVPMQNDFDVSMCSPWLSKELPLSVENCKKSPLQGTIYTSLSVTHSSADEFVVAQETDSRVGYAHPGFAAKATVAFPPICEGEIWTIGWIQAVTKLDTRYCFENKTLVVFFPIITSTY